MRYGYGYDQGNMSMSACSTRYTFSVTVTSNVPSALQSRGVVGSAPELRPTNQLLRSHIFPIGSDPLLVKTSTALAMNIAQTVFAVGV